jgi:hypothetical protein
MNVTSGMLDCLAEGNNFWEQGNKVLRSSKARGAIAFDDVGLACRKDVVFIAPGAKGLLLVSSFEQILGKFNIHMQAGSDQRGKLRRDREPINHLFMKSRKLTKSKGIQNRGEEINAIEQSIHTVKSNCAESGIDILRKGRVARSAI